MTMNTGISDLVTQRLAAVRFADMPASTVTASAMPSEKDRPRQPLVAMPRT